mgnify:CR=1 FL=1
MGPFDLTAEPGDDRGGKFTGNGECDRILCGLHHHAHERFGAGRADHDPAVLAERDEQFAHQPLDAHEIGLRPQGTFREGQGALAAAGYVPITGDLLTDVRSAVASLA